MGSELLEIALHCPGIVYLVHVERDQWQTVDVTQDLLHLSGLLVPRVHIEHGRESANLCVFTSVSISQIQKPVESASPVPTC